jgi:transcriptional regulator with XRE-family HTH domain
MIEIWVRVKQKLDEMGKSQNELARVIGVSSAQASAWVVNDRIPRADDCLKIADYLGVSVRWLLTGEEEEPGVTPEQSLAKVVYDHSLLSIMRRLGGADKPQVEAIENLLKSFGL